MYGAKFVWKTTCMASMLRKCVKSLFAYIVCWRYKLCNFFGFVYSIPIAGV